MRLGVEGHGDGGVTEQLLNELRMNTLAEQQSRARVTQVVKASLWQPCSFQERLERAGTKIMAVQGCTDEKGIATFEGGAKVAYFRDPDGNTLSIAQAPRS